MSKETMKRRFHKLLSLTPSSRTNSSLPSGTPPAKEGAGLSWFPKMLSIQTKESLPFRGPLLLENELEYNGFL